MREEDFQSLTNYRLQQAMEALEDSQILLDSGRYRAAANRLYYACFYAAIAALLTKRLQYSKHSAVIAFFDREFISTGHLPRDYSRTIHRAFNERQQDDYMPFVQLDPDEIRSLSADVRTLVKGIGDYVAASAEPEQ
jgi:uncharacterized protein (UPF0332 family)